ncbi:MAG: tRNA lysidine(34) synthetase TilS [Bacteroidota bacterium]|nr:tRNA lysidine(34) synthetase TilS [Bacteroidota bacterium]
MKENLEQIFISEINPYKDSKFLLAVSGGVDSMVLANLFLSNKLYFSIAHCNFQLRGKESESDQKVLSDWCEINNIEFFVKKFNTKDYCKEQKLTVQMGARKLRYEWFGSFIEKGKVDFIVTAHHLDDQLETFIINSIRGTGIEGLLGIPNNVNNIIRPLLMTSKDQIIQYAELNKINYNEDSSNEKEDYLRNKIRHSVIPYLKSDDKNVLLKFRTTIKNLNKTSIFIEHVCAEWKEMNFFREGDTIITNIYELENLFPRDFYIHELFKEFQFNYKEVIKLFDSDSGKYISSPYYKMTKNKNTLIITKINND